MDISSPVVHDITVRTVITKMILEGWDSEVVDVTTAFLHGKMEEEVYMRCPEGIDLVEKGWDLVNDCAELKQTIYGTKQAARQYWKMFMETMEKKGFERTNADSCLIKRKDDSGTVIMCIYVDDCLITGERKAIDAAMKDMEDVFETRRIGQIQEYVGCTFIDLPDGRKKMIQPDLINKLETTFKKEIIDIRDPKHLWDQELRLCGQVKMKRNLVQIHKKTTGVEWECYYIW
jgi:phosphotransacetylase